MNRSLPHLLLVMVLGSSCASIAPKQSRTAVLENFESIEEAQKKPVWCWAACASMIHRFNGIEISQDEIAERIHKSSDGGELKVAAASRYEVYQALCPTPTDFSFDQIWKAIEDDLEREKNRIGQGADQGQTATGVDVDADPMVAVHVALDRYLPTRAAPLEALASDQPAVVGLRGNVGGAEGHLCVIVGAAWKEAPAYAKSFDRVVRSGAELTGAVSRGDLRRLDRSLLVAKEASSRLRVDVGDTDWIEVVDPWFEDDKTTDVNEMRRRLTQAEFAEKVVFVATVDDARAVLTRWNDLVKIEVRTEGDDLKGATQ